MGNKYGAFPGSMGNMQNLMKQAQKMQQELQKKQEEAANTEFEVSVGGGAVTIKATGDKKILGVSIKKEVVEQGDVEMIEDLVLTAINEALNKADGMMGDGMDGMNIPGMF